ncbi:hypothetical protein [Sutcliffiella sp. FSL R7-0096]|uniref:hypothetical protein n=1 Tax=Sutcliffiella sp. FSL R7-0096 TaxID=2921670 RepID=UPI00315A2A70
MGRLALFAFMAECGAARGVSDLEMGLVGDLFSVKPLLFSVREKYEPYRLIYFPLIKNTSRSTDPLKLRQIPK